MSKHRTHKTMWSRLLSGLLCLALALGFLPTVGLIQTAEAHWADPYGEQLVEWGVMNPSSDLRLGATLTRAEFVAMCNRAFGYDKLGSTPFTDVPSSAWYAQDINIAYNAGYFQGTSTTTASPNSTLTREQAAVLVARNLMLQETVGEVQGFTDSHNLSEWSRGLIGAAVAEGMINGLPDGSFAPNTNITRGEIAAMLVRVIGTPINKAGDYELGGVYGNVMISSSNVTLRNTTIAGNLYITGGVDLGNVLLENVTVLGRIVISGGGESHAGQSSIVLRNVKADELVIDSMIDQFTTVSAYGITDIPVTYVRSDAYLEDASSPGYGLQYIEFNADPGALLQLAGTIKEVVNKTPFSTLQLAQGTAEKITIDEYATNSELILDINTRVNELNLDVATLVYGKGDITNLTIGAADCEVEILPEHVNIRPGIVATVAGEVVDSNGAAELSSDPRLLAGYPKVANLTPTTAEAQFSGNKQGTIYYAVSELANGSVSEEDLVNNPAYGGIIYKGQAGTIAAASKTVYSRAITDLVPDGSYYLTAMLEDGRGNRSPIKVVSFTTPDDTVPEFLNGRISRETCDVVQLTGMANKSCTLYWVLLADGAAEPTPQNFKTGSFGGNYGSGSMSVVKNVPISITVNTTRLREDTDYVLYVWLNDFDGAQSSKVYRFDVHTPDETPPVVISVEQTGFGESDAEVTFRVNEAPSTLYWAVVVESNETFIIEEDDWTTNQRNQIKVENGKKAGAIVSGSMAAAGANVDTIISNITGLLYSTYKTHSFKFYYVAKDAAGNYSAVGREIIHTLDTDPPHAWLEFSDAVNGSPRANSDIKIVFDEQVKGGASAAKTFLEYYEDVKNNVTGAKDALAKELDAHFELWYVPKNGSPSKQTSNTSTPAIGSGGVSNWVVNWCEAVITMEGGNMVITLAGTDHDDMKQALNLDSGANYQIRLKGVYDDAFTPNAMAVGEDGVSCVKTGGTASTTNDNGNSLPRLYFTTLYAQVELYENTSVSKMNASGEVFDQYRLDLVVDVKPTSTGKVPDTEYWDMIMWSDTVMTVDVYRQKIQLDSNGNEISASAEPWTKVNNDPIRFGSSGAGVGLSYTKSPQEYEKVTEGLVEGYLYRYGIHIRTMGIDAVSEGKPDEAPTSWSDMVTMKFSLIAGTEGNVRNVSMLVNANYDSYVSGNNVNNSVSEIGVVYTSKGTESILECSKQFVDTAPPAFQSNYPKFTNVGSSAMTMEVALDRPGRVYYVVAPVDAITVNTGKYTVDTTNDGREEREADAENQQPEVKHQPGQFTYIPKDGIDRDSGAYNTDILFKAGDSTNNGNKKYSAPTYLQVYNGSTTWKNNSRVKTGYVDVDSNTAIEYATITGLESTTEYYICIVLEGYGGGNDDIVQIYRQDTTKPQVPNVIVTGTASSATIEVTEDSEVTMVLVEYNSVPSNIRGNGGTGTYLYQMLYRADGGKKGPSEFDEEGDVTAKTLVLQYVLGTSGGTSTSVAGSWTLPGVGPDNKRYDSVPANSVLPFNFEEYMTSTSSEYVLLVVARHSSGGYTIYDYGYGAARGLYTPDKIPPEFINSNPIEGYIMGNMQCNTPGNWKNGTWSKQPNAYTYGGSVTLDFTKDLYWHDTSTNTRYQIVYSGGDKTKGTVDLKDILSGSAVSYLDESKMTSTAAVGSSITLYFKTGQEDGLPSTASLTFPSTGYLCNASDYTTTKKLTLNFRALSLTSWFYKDVIEGADIYWPGFSVSWG